MKIKRRINNLNSLKHRRKNLRNNLTPAEAKLWSLLKGSTLKGWKFRRQHSIGPFIPDFYCPLGRLVVELDGAYHFTEEGLRYDVGRTAYLNRLEVRVLRFENRFLFERPDVVLATLLAWLEDRERGLD